MYTENNKALMKETEEDTNKLKIYCLYLFKEYKLEELVLLKCPYIQSNLQIQCNSHQYSSEIFHRNKQPNICMEPQKPLNSQNSLEKEEQSWRHHTS